MTTNPDNMTDWTAFEAISRRLYNAQTTAGRAAALEALRVLRYTSQGSNREGRTDIDSYVMDLIIPLLQDKEATIRRTALELVVSVTAISISHGKGRDLVDRALQAMTGVAETDPDDGMRSTAVYYAAEKIFGWYPKRPYGHAATVAEITRHSLSKDESPWVQRSALAAARIVCGHSQEFAELLLGNIVALGMLNNVSIRYSALECLADIGKKYPAMAARVLPPLISMMKTPDVRLKAVIGERIATVLHHAGWPAIRPEAASLRATFNQGAANAPDAQTKAIYEDLLKSLRDVKKAGTRPNNGGPNNNP